MVHGISIDMANLISRTLSGVSDKCIEVDHEIASRSISVESGTTQMVLGWRFSSALTGLPPNGAQWYIGFGTGGALPTETVSSGQAYWALRADPNQAWSLNTEGVPIVPYRAEYNIEGTTTTSLTSLDTQGIVPLSSDNAASFLFIIIAISSGVWRTYNFWFPHGNFSSSFLDFSQQNFEDALASQSGTNLETIIKTANGSSITWKENYTVDLWSTSINASGGLPDTIFFRSYLSGFPLQLASVGAYRWA